MKLLTKIGMIACGLAIAPTTLIATSCGGNQVNGKVDVEFRGNLTSGFNISYSNQASTQEDYVIKFESALDENGNPTHKNIEKDDLWVQYQNPNFYSVDGWYTLEYTLENNVLTIKKEKIVEMYKESEAGKKFVPKIRIIFKGAQISDNIEWTDLANIASNPTTGIDLAKKYFSIGDWKYLTINSKKHKIKIVDMGGCVGEDGQTKLVFTFEFNNVLTGSDGKAINVAWNDDQGAYAARDFATSTLNTYLNDASNGVLGLIQNALGEAKTAIKKTKQSYSKLASDNKTWETANYTPSVFIKGNETYFSYWNDIIKADKSKVSEEGYLKVTQAEGSNNDQHYWFRAVLTNGTYYDIAYNLNYSTLWSNIATVDSKYPILPCFSF